MLLLLVCGVVVVVVVVADVVGVAVVVVVVVFCRPTHLLEVNALSGQSNSSCSALRPRGGTHEACTRTSAWRGTSGKTTRILVQNDSK